MTSVEYRFIEPLDILLLRGNKLFGGPGSFGESLMPPWPSVIAGAIRSSILATDGKIDIAAFAKGAQQHPELGTPQAPGSFAVTFFTLAKRSDNMIEMLFLPPADLVIIKNKKDNITIHRMKPQPKPDGILSSYPLSLVPVLAETDRNKPVFGYWLTQAGWKKYLAGEVPTADDLVEAATLWENDFRVGVGLEPGMRRAAKGRLFTMQAVSMCKNVGFLVGVTGAKVPDKGLLRLGGDGRAASIHGTDFTPQEPDYSSIARSRRCRIVLTTPGIFPSGWKLPGMDSEETLHIGNIKARVVSACIPRAEIISGWDIANGRPKPALRAAPTGSVYWLEDIEATANDLRRLFESGLWTEQWNDPARRAEGFNRFVFAEYK